MNGGTPSVTARTLVARSRRPAARIAATAAARLAGGTPQVPPQGVPAPASVLTAGPAAPLARQAPGPQATAPQTPVPGTPVVDASAPEAIVPPSAPQAPATWTPAPPTAPATPGRAVWHPAAIDQAHAGSPPAGSPAAGIPLVRSARPPAQAPPAVGAAGPGRLPRHDALRPPVRPTAAADPSVRDLITRPGPGVPSRTAGATPYVERALRPARSAAEPDAGVAQPAVAAPPEPAAVTRPAPERTPAASGPSASPRAAPGHPPVTIGEIHVHVTEPATAAEDPLALLAPYARGLTARRDGAW